MPRPKPLIAHGKTLGRKPLTVLPVTQRAGAPARVNQLPHPPINHHRVPRMPRRLLRRRRLPGFDGAEPEPLAVPRDHHAGEPGAQGNGLVDAREALAHGLA